MSDKDAQRTKMASAPGFIAALDQSGGSTPKALGLYGIKDGSWSSEEEMYGIVHAMRTRIITSPAFSGERVLAAILFENTMDRAIEDMPTARFLWQKKNVVPILKVDKGLADEKDGVQLMKPMPQLADLLARANEQGIFGTKMRSVIKEANANGIAAVVEQQFDIGNQTLDTGLVPIIEPEVDIHCPDKATAEGLLRDALMRHLDTLAADRQVMLKLTLPEEDDFYRPCIEHERLLRVLALSGGYSREEANLRLSCQHGMVASFSRALAEGLSAQQSDVEFNTLLNQTIQSIFDASIT